MTDIKFIEDRKIVKHHIIGISDLYNFIDNIQTDIVIPIINYKNIYKVYTKDFEQNYIYQLDKIENYCIFYKIKYDIENTVYLLLKDNNQYVNVIIYKDEKENKFFCIYDCKSNENNISPLLINKIFNKEYKLSDSIKCGVSGYIIFPNILIDKETFLDFIFLEVNPTNMYANESIKTSKDKNEIHIIYIYDTETSVGSILSSKIEMEDNKEKKYTQVRLKFIELKDEKILDKIILSYKKILDIYLKNKIKIQNIYKRFIDNFEQQYLVTKVHNITKKIKFDNRRKCDNKASDITDEVDIDDCDDDDKDYCIINVDEKSTFGVEGKKIRDKKNNIDHLYITKTVDDNNRYYICDKDPERKIPYFVPGTKQECCSIAGTVRLGKQQKTNITTQKKLITFGSTGDINDIMFNILSFITPTKWYRFGMDMSPVSFINCVLYGLYKYNKDELKNYLHKLKNDDINEVIRKKVKKDDLLFLSNRIKDISKNYINITLQETYNIDKQILYQNLDNIDEYYDPIYFISVLEYLFEINIFLIKNEGNGIILPNYTRNYYKNNNYSKNIYIHVNYGSEMDNKIYPQCELLFSENFIFENKQNLYTTLYKQYIIGNIYNFSHISKTFLDELNIISQYVDIYGKTRRINIELDNKNYTLYFEPPLQPFNVQLDDTIFDIKRKLTNEDTIMVFLRRFGEINYPINNKHIFKNLYQTIYIQYNIPIQQSILTKYKTNSVISKYLIEYSYWLFSKYLYDNNIKGNIENKHYLSFIEKYVVIDPLFIYDIKQESMYFSEDKSICIKNKKLILTSEKLQKHILYNLKIFSKRHIKKLYIYYTKNIIENIADDTSFYKEYENEIIGNDINIIYENIVNMDIKHIVHTNVKMFCENNKPYFLKLDKLDNNLYLAFNNTTFNDAMFILKYWDDKQKIPYIYKETSYDKKILLDKKVLIVTKKKNNYKVYNYVHTDIENIPTFGLEVTDDEDFIKNNNKIIMYMRTGKLVYTVLLKL